MHEYTRAIVAAAAFAVVTGKKVAGVYDHSAGRDRRIAAEARDGRLQGIDGDRAVKFGGTLPELYDAGDKAFVSLETDGTKFRGYDRATSGFYAGEVSEGVVQVFDHSLGMWFAYDIQDAEAAQSYHRKA
ncbi:MAG TPA: hypothetical protein VMQ93_01855 [Novosphingobium sp.]|nr:hypothetical protein [Novosphingobium sp.]